MAGKLDGSGIKRLVVRYPESIEKDLELIKGLFDYWDRASKNKSFITGVRIAAAYIRRIKFRKDADADNKREKISKQLEAEGLFSFPRPWEL